MWNKQFYKLQSSLNSIWMVLWTCSNDNKNDSYYNRQQQHPYNNKHFFFNNINLKHTILSNEI